ncbi:MAG: 2-succinyl-5-enolpyruvyl-6-hydroxy-3-cyclohexene-1-carboxylic-acid synthase [Actinomycetota bacterium]
MVGDAPLPQDVQATFCATLVDEWIARGVRHAVVAPGSRSTPLALAVTDRPELSVHVVHDERVAAFVTLGIGVAAREGAGPDAPALLICTSGTASANFLPAVAEAGLSEIPMLVLTADRPEELRGVGAPQTIDQLDLYGTHVRWWHDPGVPTIDGLAGWRGLAADAISRTASGPVHLNLPFREPLVGTPLQLPGRIEPVDEPETAAGASTADPLDVEAVDRQRGLILAGGASGVAADDVAALHAATQWPILADPLSGLRHLDGVITSTDALLRHERFAVDHAPEVVVRIGRPATSRLLAEWTARQDLTVVQVGGPGRIDPARNVDVVTSIDALLELDLTGASGTTWMARWRHADRRADDAIAEVLDGQDRLTEPGVARTVASALPSGARLTVSSSMPVRDLEWYAGRDAVAHANRGANGIDGVTSTALGRALADRLAVAHVVLIGDLAFVHDSNALVSLLRRGVDLRVVVVDNDGGGIFSFLPQRTLLEHGRYEQLFGTPLGADVVAIARAHGLETADVETRDELEERLAMPGPWVVRVRTDRDENLAVHRSLHDAVAAAL